VIDVIAERAPLGGLERWLDDPSIDEVIVNGRGDVWIECAGSLRRVGTMSRSAVMSATEHILRPIGRRIDRSNPMVDARLPDGSRVCAVIEPIAVDGPCLTIRRFAVCTRPLSAFAPPAVAALQQTIVE
jgi:pilus assembly protein CpaF